MTTLAPTKTSTPTPLASQPLRLRDDLEINRLETATGVVYQVRDGEWGAFYRFKEIEHEILKQFDGTRSLDEIREAIEAKYDAPLPLETLKGFVARLRELDLLEKEGTVRRKRPGRVRGSLLYLRVRMLNPDRVLNWLKRPMSFLFTRGFVVCSSLLLVFAIGVALANLAELSRGLGGLLAAKNILPALTVMFFVTTLHEFAHGLTCKFYGGPVREMGFLLIYLQPAFYCDVSSAWQFAEKRKRLWVTFAGAWCELVCWSLAVLIWRVTQPNTWLHYAALIVVATSGIKCLFNLNPLIKLDGYYLLSDALDIPNLRQRSFQYLGRQMGRLGGKKSEAAEPPVRERRVYLLFGILAGVYSFGLLGWVLANLGGYLMENYQGAGFASFGAFVFLLVGLPILKRLRSRRQSQGNQSAPKSRGWLRFAKVAAGLGTLVSLLNLWQMELRISGDCTVLPAERVTLRSEVAGMLVDIQVSEGQRVEKGQIVARLANDQLRLELEQVQAELDRQASALEKLRNGATLEELELARRKVETARIQHKQALHRLEEAKKVHAARVEESLVQVENAKTQLDFQTRTWKRVEQLREKSAVSAHEYEKAENVLKLDQHALNQALAKHRLLEADDLAEFRQAAAVAACEESEAIAQRNLLLAGSRPEDIRAVEAEIRRLRAREQFLKSEIGKTQILSPIAGIVTTRSPEEQRGRSLSPSDVIVEIQALDTIEMEIAVPEKEIGDVHGASPVAIKLRAYPETTLEASVVGLAPTIAESEPDTGSTNEPHVAVSVQIPNEEYRLRTGMTGKAKISCGRRSAWELMTRRLARFVRVEFWSYW